MHNMNVLDLLIGRKMLVPTDMKVDVELEIKKVIENTHTTSVELEPATQANDWWPATSDTTTVDYIVEFTNGAKKHYSSLSQIKVL